MLFLSALIRDAVRHLQNGAIYACTVAIDVVLARVERGLLEESALREWMDGALERAEDRTLFGLDAPESR